MSDKNANPYLKGGLKPFPVPRLDYINPYLGRDPSPFPLNRTGHINPQYQPSRAPAEPICRNVKTEATVVIAARARRGWRQTQRLKANGKQAAEA